MAFRVSTVEKLQILAGKDFKFLDNLFDQQKTVKSTLEVKCLKHQQKFKCCPDYCFGQQRISGCQKCQKEERIRNNLLASKRAAEANNLCSRRAFVNLVNSNTNFNCWENTREQVYVSNFFVKNIIKSFSVLQDNWL